MLIDSDKWEQLMKAHERYTEDQEIQIQTDDSLYHIVRSKGCDYCPGTKERPHQTIVHALFLATRPTRYERIWYEIKRSFSLIKNIIKERSC